MKVVPQTHKMHCYFPISSSQLMVAETSDSAEFKVVSIFQSTTTSEADSEPESAQLEEAEYAEAIEGNISVGQWVIVNMINPGINQHRQ